MNVLNNLSMRLGLRRGQARQEFLDRDLILFPRLIKTFAVAVAGQDDQSFIRAGGVGIKVSSNGRGHPAVILECNEENGAIADPDHCLDEIKV